LTGCVENLNGVANSVNTDRNSPDAAANSGKLRRIEAIADPTLNKTRFADTRASQKDDFHFLRRHSWRVSELFEGDRTP
jgi:hypothetical protein